MNRLLRDRTKSILLTLFLIPILLYWITEEEQQQTFISNTVFAERNSNIETVKIEYSDNKVNLYVYSSKPMACGAIIEELGVRNIVISDRTYKPTCSVVKENVMRITYTEAKTV